jgi:wyosine [tRNA(Phe)-imidazoG37] synthetase (radical SAM superfamily)
MQYLFGPVPSRRLGQSLGIDPTVVPGKSKTCNWNCVYCQLGHTSPLESTRRRFFDPAMLVDELEAFLERAPYRGTDTPPGGTNPEAVETSTDYQAGIDWITFVGSGEPTLNIDLGFMIRAVKAMTTIPVAVITNGSLLSLPELREELAEADAVMPTLDAGDETTFLRINRPHHDFNFDRHLNGLVEFRKIYRGKLWVETMLIDGVNDDEKSLGLLARGLARLAPDEVHLVLPTRPPAESWVKPASGEGLVRARAILGPVCPVVHPDEAYGDFGLNAADDPLEAAARTLLRHPMSDAELRQSLGRWGAVDVDGVVCALEASGRGTRVERYGTVFWRGSMTR